MEQMLGRHQQGVERNVTAVALDHTEPMRVDESTLSTVKLVAFLPWKSQSYASTSSSYQLGAIPMEQRKWLSYQGSTGLMIHGAVEWRKTAQPSSTL